ncbi:hypothetical protein ES703_84791 [subsurface metagenome]
MKISSPALYPAFSTASKIYNIAFSFVFKFGANPPSSPTDVEYPLLLRMFFKVQNISVPILNDSLKESALTGTIINS